MKKQKSSSGILYQTFRYLFVFVILSLVYCFVTSFFFLNLPNLLSQFIIPYKITKAFLVLISIFPSLQVGTFLFSFSVLFSKMDAENMLERYEAMSAYLKTLVIVLTIMFAFNITISEFTEPLLNRKLKSFETKTEIYKSSLYKANTLKNIKNLHSNKMAINFVKHAMEIDPNSSDARHLLEELTLKQVALLEVKESETKQNLQTANLNAKMLLNLVNQSVKKRDFFSAHYFASRAAEMTTKNSEEYKIAEKLVKDSWHAIENGDDSLQKQNRILYEQKLAAYSTLRRNQYLKAFKLFYAIKENIKSTDDTLNDIQVNYFLDEIKKELSKKVFYYEDLEQSVAFRDLNNFTFQINNGKHKLYEITLGRIAYKKPNAPNDTAKIFLQDVNLVKYNYVNQISWKLHADYARLVPRVNDESKQFSTLQLTMVSKNRSMPDVFPEQLIGKIAENDLLSQDLPISVENFLLAISKQEKMSNLDVSTLHKLTKESGNFGFKKNDFLKEMLFRISYPLLLFIVEFALASLSWNLRFNHNQFHFSYFFMLPAIFYLANIILEISIFTMQVLLDCYLIQFGDMSFIFVILTWMVFTIFYAWKFYRQARN